MHEFSIVEAMITQVVAKLPTAKRGDVQALRFRRGSTFSEDALRQAFEMVSKGTILENTALLVETVNHHYHCVCGYEQVITSDDLTGHMYVCPQCGTVAEIDEAHDLTLLEVIMKDALTSQPS